MMTTRGVGAIETGAAARMVRAETTRPAHPANAMRPSTAARFAAYAASPPMPRAMSAAAQVGNPPTEHTKWIST